MRPASRVLQVPRPAQQLSVTSTSALQLEGVVQVTPSFTAKLHKLVQVRPTWCDTLGSRPHWPLALLQSRHSEFFSEHNNCSISKKSQTVASSTSSWRTCAQSLRQGWPVLILPVLIRRGISNFSLAIGELGNWRNQRFGPEHERGQRSSLASGHRNRSALHQRNQ